MQIRCGAAAVIGQAPELLQATVAGAPPLMGRLFGDRHEPKARRPACRVSVPMLRPRAFERVGSQSDCINRRCEGRSTTAFARPGRKDCVPMLLRSRRPSAFTLVELLVVISIIGLIMALVGPRVLNYLSESKVKAARIQIELSLIHI